MAKEFKLDRKKFEKDKKRFMKRHLKGIKLEKSKVIERGVLKDEKKYNF